MRLLDGHCATRRRGARGPVALLIATLLVMGVGFAGAAFAAPQEEEEIVSSARFDGNKLIVIAAGIEMSPDGAFSHDSSDQSVVFRGGEPVSFKGTDEETRDVERAEIRRDRLVLYLEQGRVRNKATPSTTLGDGVWRSRNGSELTIEDGKIVTVKGLKGDV